MRSDPETATARFGLSGVRSQKTKCRFREEGEDRLLDRSSAPRAVPSRISEERVAVIAALRGLRMTAAEIAETLSLPLSTVSGVLARIGLGKLSRLEPPEPPNRYERRREDELLHVDVKKLGRIGRPGHRFNGGLSDSLSSSPASRAWMKDLCGTGHVQMSAESWARSVVAAAVAKGGSKECA